MASSKLAADLLRSWGPHLLVPRSANRLACTTAALPPGTYNNPAASSSSNLGMLQGLAQPEMPSSRAAAAEIPAFTGGGAINVDGTAIASSLVVLALLLALSLNRILGLERLLGKWLVSMAEQRQDARRNDVLAARQALERQFAEDEDEDNGGKRGNA